mgnify:CR=1 FL=1
MRQKPYGQDCSLAKACDLLCERWTFLIIRELLIQPCRFRDLNLFLDGMGTNLLAQRLKDLEAHGLVKRQNPSDRKSPYILSPRGRALEPAVLSLIRWGLTADTRAEEPKGVHFAHWDLLALKAFYKPENCHRRLTLQFDTSDFKGWCRVVPAAGCQISTGWAGDFNILYPGTVQDFYKTMREALSRPAEERSAESDRAGLHEFAECFF